MLERSPDTAVSAPATAASACFARASSRAWRTTLWPSPTMSRAAICPRPSAAPVMNMRAILAILAESDALYSGRCCLSPSRRNDHRRHPRDDADKPDQGSWGECLAKEDNAYRDSNGNPEISLRCRAHRSQCPDETKIDGEG